MQKDRSNLRLFCGSLLAMLIASPACRIHAQTSYAAPAPEGQPSAQVADTVYTTRLWGHTPAEEAVSVTRHTFTATMPVSDPAEMDAAADRPRAVVLVTPEDEVQAISATELIHFPNNAPVLFTEPSGMPAVTQNELKRLSPVGIARANGIQVFLVGTAASAAVKEQVAALGLKTKVVTGSDKFDLANQIDKVYGEIQGGVSGVPSMSGNAVMDVFVGSTDAADYMLPATSWCAHMPSGILWVDGQSDTLPASTIEALKRRMSKAMIYVMGGTQQVSDKLVKALSDYGSVMRVTNDDEIASNAPRPISPVEVSVAFARMWDPVGMMGWNFVGPGHGFTVVNVKNWQGAVAGAVMGGVGFHAPILLTDSAQHLSKPAATFLSTVEPNFTVTPAEGPYNMLYMVGDYAAISWIEQVEINASQEMANRHDAPNGGLYVTPR
jgi:putative cell wall-binding protein